ncbi:cupin domain-containing protein [Leisingera sp. ANG-Vp]|uniref:cupin domain-containing protein n=1 Tax=Leisingera sp. ANG-Vp TaxID=1577896 RepID=UPI00057ED987|nr:cupin domain-containing protein [Leisingera sp. ANG-Vp]KIC17305.1 hypothetical protein RA20_15505 [Leisingera sp. ANG-Vp]
MSRKTETTTKKTVVSGWHEGRKYFMAPDEYTSVAAGKDDTGSDYVFGAGEIAPGNCIPDHYHKWEDQTFHIIEGELEVKIGDKVFQAGPGASIQCPRGTSHYMKNTGGKTAKIISYIFPGDWAEDFMAETSRQNETGERDLKLIEERFGVVYL